MMLPPKTQLPHTEQQLLRLFRGLSADDQKQLMTFAEFLDDRAKSLDSTGNAEPLQVIPPPAEISRPASESVVAAIRRLSETFPMLDRGPLLHETSALMTAHVMQGRSAEHVIDELESLFRQHYDRLVSGSG